MKEYLAWILVVALGTALLTSCATSPRTYQGATAGGVLGAAAGALIDKHNRWRGAMIGGTLGATFGGTVTEISSLAAREAAQTRRPVTYRSADGWQRVQAEPVAYDYRTRCHKVHERVWHNGRLVKDRVREVCKREKTIQTY